MRYEANVFLRTIPIECVCRQGHGNVQNSVAPRFKTYPCMFEQNLKTFLSKQMSADDVEACHHHPHRYTWQSTIANADNRFRSSLQ